MRSLLLDSKLDNIMCVLASSSAVSTIVPSRGILIMFLSHSRSARKLCRITPLKIVTILKVFILNVVYQSGKRIMKSSQFSH